MFYAYTRPRYKVTVYRAIGPLVIRVSSIMQAQSLFDFGRDRTCTFESLAIERQNNYP